MTIINKNVNLGFMQGRLSPMIENMIQRFPIDDWKNEIHLANKFDWYLMEWTIDYFTFDRNPILNDDFKITDISPLKVNSITADFFMQDPFFLIKNKQKKDKLIADFKRVINCMKKNEIQNIVLPLVDNGSLIKNDISENYVIENLSQIFQDYKDDNINFIFESDFEPEKLLSFIEKFNSNKVGINYDSGNSASLGFDSEKEIKTYGNWIKNCHLKDRVKGGSTVEFGKGDTDFKKVIQNLNRIKYSNDFIIQGARSNNNKDIEILNQYRDYILDIVTNEF